MFWTRIGTIFDKGYGLIMITRILTAIIQIEFAFAIQVDIDRPYLDLVDV